MGTDNNFGSLDTLGPASGSGAFSFDLARAVAQRPENKPDLREPSGGNAYANSLRREINSETDPEKQKQLRSELAAFDQERLKLAIDLNNDHKGLSALPILLSVQSDEQSDKGASDQALNHQLAIALYGSVENLNANPVAHLNKFDEYANAESSTAREYNRHLHAAEGELQQAKSDAQRQAEALKASNTVLETERKSYSDQITQLANDTTVSAQAKAIEKQRLTQEVASLDSLMPQAQHAKNLFDVCTFLDGIANYRLGNDQDANALFTKFSAMLDQNQDLAKYLGIPSNFKSPKEYVDFLIDETKDRGAFGLGNWWHKHREDVTKGLIVLGGAAAGVAAGAAAGVGAFLVCPPAAPAAVILAAVAADSVTQGGLTSLYEGQLSKRAFLEGGVEGGAIGLGLVTGGAATAALPELAVAEAGTSLTWSETALNTANILAPRFAAGVAYASVNNIGKEAIKSYYDQDGPFSWNVVLAGTPKDIIAWTALGGSASKISSMLAGRGSEPLLNSISTPWGLTKATGEWILRTDASTKLAQPFLVDPYLGLKRSLTGEKDPDTLVRKFNSQYRWDVP
jgi:hypothetical protein